MAETRTYQGQTYTRSAPGQPWILVGPAQQGGGMVLVDPTAAEEEARKREDQEFQRRQLDISAQNAAIAAQNANKPPEGFVRRADGGLQFIPGGPADPAVIAARKQAEAKATADAKAPGTDPDRAAQVLTALENIRQLRELADQTLAVGTASDWVSGIPFLGQNRADVEGALKMVQGDLIQQQIAKLSAINGGNGVASIANSETEAARMAASIANLDPNQTPEQFQIGLDRAEAYYRRQLEQMKAQTPVIEPAPLKAAGAGATEASRPIPAGMQAEHMAYLRANWGRLDPQAYAQFRVDLDKKYEFASTPEEYAASVADINKVAQEGFTPEQAGIIPPVVVPLTENEQEVNNFLNTDVGRFSAAYLNAGGAGLAGLLPGFSEKMELMRDESDGEMFAGDLLGSTVGTGIVGKGLGLVAKEGSLLANPLAADMLYGGIYGANEGGPTGAVTGVGGAFLGNKLGGWGGEAVARRVAPPDPLNAGERAIQASVTDVDPVLAALNQADQLGVPMTLADASPELSSLAGSATRFSPTVAGEARRVMAMRNQGQVDRLASAVERDLGPVTNIPQRSEDLLQQARTAAGPLYDAAYNAPGAGAVFPSIEPLVNRPSMRQALARARTIAAEEGRDPTALGFDVNDAGEVVLNRVPSWQTLDYAKRGIDDVLETFRDKTTGKLRLDEHGRAIDATRRDFLKVVDAANPDYAAARAVYAGPVQERGFLQRGQDVMRTRPDELGVQMAGMTPEQAAQMRLGYQSELMGRAGDVRNNTNPFAQLNTPNTEGRLGVLYNGADDANIARLLNQRDLELQLAGSANRLIGNSATAERSVADEFFKQAPTGLGGDVAQGVVESALLGAPFLTVGKRVGDRLWRDKREAAALAANRSLADEIGPILLNDAPAEAAVTLSDIIGRAAEYDPVLKALVEQYRERGGHYLAGMGAATAVAPTR